MANQWWGVITVIGVWGWILSAAGFILGTFPARDRFNRKSAAIWGGGFLFFYVIWIVGMMNA